MASIQSDFQSFAQGNPLYTVPDSNVPSIARQYPYNKLERRTKIMLLKLSPNFKKALPAKY